MLAMVFKKEFQEFIQHLNSVTKKKKNAILLQASQSLTLLGNNFKLLSHSCNKKRSFCKNMRICPAYLLKSIW